MIPSISRLLLKVLGMAHKAQMMMRTMIVFIFHKYVTSARRFAYLLCFSTAFLTRFESSEHALYYDFINDSNIMICIFKRMVGLDMDVPQEFCLFNIQISLRSIFLLHVKAILPSELSMKI